MDLTAGLALVCFTDGILEAESSDGLAFAEERMLAISAAHAGESIENLLAGVQGELARFLDGKPPPDDCTMLGVRRPQQAKV